MNKVFKVGLIGCGHISETYFRAEKYFNNIKIIKCADINHQNALKCSKTYKTKAWMLRTPNHFIAASRINKTSLRLKLLLVLIMAILPNVYNENSLCG